MFSWAMLRMHTNFQLDKQLVVVGEVCIPILVFSLAQGEQFLGSNDGHVLLPQPRVTETRVELSRVVL